MLATLVHSGQLTITKITVGGYGMVSVGMVGMVGYGRVLVGMATGDLPLRETLCVLKPPLIHSQARIDSEHRIVHSD